MDDREKLKLLLDHWQQHNADHAATYSSWATTMEALDRADVASLLREAVVLTESITALFQRAYEAL